VAFPVANARLRHRIREDLERYLQDTANAWLLGSDGSYQRAADLPAETAVPSDAVASDAPVADSQAQLLDAYAAAARLPE